MPETDQLADKATTAAAAPKSRSAKMNESMEGMSVVFDQFARTFEASAKRWETIVYPLLFAFMLLAGYGFYLIYQLTEDVSKITGNMDAIANSMLQVSQHMQGVSGDMHSVSDNMHIVTVDMGKIVAEVQNQDVAMTSMAVSLERMTRSMDTMSIAVYQMRGDTAFMGHNVQNATGPMRFMNTFMPW